MAGNGKKDAETSAALAIVDREKKQAENALTEQQEREHAISQVFELAGKVKTLSFTESQAAFFKLICLKQAKETKEYREKCGMTWDEFCSYVGVDRRRIDEQLIDLKPMKAQFLADFAVFSGFDFSKIKYLGLSVSAESAEIQGNSIVYRGETIQIMPGNEDEIKAVIERMEEDYKATIEDQAASLKAAGKWQKKMNEEIHKLQKKLDLHENKVDLEELSEEDAEAFAVLKKLQGDFVAGLQTIKKLVEKNSSPLVLRELYFLYLFYSKVAMEERMALAEQYAGAEEAPWEITEEELPAPDVLVDNLPLTKGMGKALKAKKESKK